MIGGSQRAVCVHRLSQRGGFSLMLLLEEAENQSVNQSLFPCPFPHLYLQL